MRKGRINQKGGGDSNKHEMHFPKFGTSFVPVLKCATHHITRRSGLGAFQNRTVNNNTCADR